MHTAAAILGAFGDEPTWYRVDRETFAAYGVLGGHPVNCRVRRAEKGRKGSYLLRMMIYSGNVAVESIYGRTRKEALQYGASLLAEKLAKR